MVDSGLIVLDIEVTISREDFIDPRKSRFSVPAMVGFKIGAEALKQLNSMGIKHPVDIHPFGPTSNYDSGNLSIPITVRKKVELRPMAKPVWKCAPEDMSDPVLSTDIINRLTGERKKTDGAFQLLIVTCKKTRGLWHDCLTDKNCPLRNLT